MKNLEKSVTVDNDRNDYENAQLWTSSIYKSKEDRSHQEGQTGSTQQSDFHTRPPAIGLRISGAMLLLTSTIGIIFVPSFFRKESAPSVFQKFPTCEPHAITIPQWIPNPAREHMSCEWLIVAMAIMVSTYWLVILNLVWTEWWRRRKRHMVIYSFGLAVIVMGGILVHDPAALFLEVVPVALDALLVLYLAIDCAARR